ncbi:PH domain-containing protein [Candidatus Berkelbacteria bacterium]|nr:PH domain-containing protein [Candidatus Berkelbacteria bacterium]
MAQPPSLRVQEQVIEEFGVSRKYVVLLVILGVLLVIGGVVLSMRDDPLIDAIALGAGPLAPLIFLLVELTLAGAGLFLLIRAFYLVVAYHYFLTNERVIETVGFLAQRTVSADYRAITDLVVRQDFINRLILNTGTLTANTPGGPGEEIVLLNIDNPQARREQLRSLAQAAMGGQRIDQEYLAQLKVQTGMAPDVMTAYQDLAHSAVNPIPGERRRPVPQESPAPAPQPRSSGISRAANPAIPGDQDAEDFNGDGTIDESERLRSAQKKMPMPGKEE